MIRGLGSHPQKAADVVASSCWFARANHSDQGKPSTVKNGDGVIMDHACYDVIDVVVSELHLNYDRGHEEEHSLVDGSFARLAALFDECVSRDISELAFSLLGLRENVDQVYGALPLAGAGESLSVDVRCHSV